MTALSSELQNPQARELPGGYGVLRRLRMEPDQRAEGTSTSLAQAVVPPAYGNGRTHNLILSMGAQAEEYRRKGAALDKLATDTLAQGMTSLIGMSALGYMSPAALLIAGKMFKNRVAGQFGSSKAYYRIASAMDASALIHNYKLQLYRYTRGDASSDMARLMDSSSFRGEWWNHWEHPSSVPMTAHLAKIKAQALELQTRTNALTRFLAGTS